MDINKVFTNKLSVTLLAVLCTILWGSAFPAVKSGFILLHIGPDAIWHKLVFAGYRFFFAGVLILIFSIATNQSIKISRELIKPIIVMALISYTLQYCFFYIGLSHTTGINASVFNSVLSFFSIVLAHFFLDNDRIDSYKALGLVLGLAGILAVNFSPELLKISFNPLGDGFVMLAQLSGAVGFIYLKKLPGKIAIIPFTAYQMILGSTLLMLPGIIKVGVIPFTFDFKSGMLMFYLAVLSASAFSIWNTLVKYNNVGRISFYLFLIPVFGTMLSAAFLQGEHITIFTVLSIMLVSAGLIIVNSNKPTPIEHSVMKNP